MLGLTLSGIRANLLVFVPTNGSHFADGYQQYIQGSPTVLQAIETAVCGLFLCSVDYCHNPTLPVRSPLCPRSTIFYLTVNPRTSRWGWKNASCNFQ